MRFIVLILGMFFLLTTYAPFASAHTPNVVTVTPGIHTIQLDVSGVSDEVNGRVLAICVVDCVDVDPFGQLRSDAAFQNAACNLLKIGMTTLEILYQIDENDQLCLKAIGFHYNKPTVASPECLWIVGSDAPTFGGFAGSAPCATR
jgi:hypothetical protein